VVELQVPVAVVVLGEPGAAAAARRVRRERASAREGDRVVLPGLLPVVAEVVLLLVPEVDRVGRRRGRGVCTVVRGGVRCGPRGGGRRAGARYPSRRTGRGRPAGRWATSRR